MGTKRICYLLIILLSMVVTKAWAYDIKVDNADGVTVYYNYINNRTELEVTKGDNYAGYSGSVVIPEDVTYMDITRKVTKIGDMAFVDCKNLTTVTIPSSVKSIGNGAFYFSGLSSITIPNSVQKIGDEVFVGCALTSFTLPNSVTSLGERFLEFCTNLSSITVETGNTIYDSRDNCNCIIETKTNKLITGCNSSTIPDNVTIIGDRAFSECRGLTSITIPNTVTSIGKVAFGRCSGLTSITIPNSVTSIGDYAFSECSGLISITIPSSLTNIGLEVFSSCSALTSISVNIGNAKFDSRDNCNAIIETKTNTLIVGCQNTIIPDNVTSIGNGAFYGCESLISITIPNSVTTIEASAFSHCSQLASVTIPNSVTTIGASAFSSCISLTSITIPNSVKSIGGFAFSGCYFTSITIPNSISIIEDGVFFQCFKMNTSVTFIGKQTFMGCRAMKSVTIPNSVTSIGEQAFGWVDLQEVISNIENPFIINTNTFSDNTYNNAKLYVPTGTIEKYKTTNSWKDFKNIEENTKTSITDIRDDRINIVKRYTIDGKTIKNPQKGINIIQMNNGTTKKVLVK